MVIALMFLNLTSVYAEKETVNERLIRVEESIKNLDMRLTQRIEDTNKRIEDTNKRIDILRHDIDRRFDDIDRRFFNDQNKNIDNMRSLIFVVMASLFSIIAMICGLIVYIVKKDRQETTPSKQEQFDYRFIVQKIDSLEDDFRQKVIPLWEHFQNNNQNQQMSYA